MINWIKKWITRDKENSKEKIRIRFELDNGKYYDELVNEDNFEERFEKLEDQFNQRKSLEEIDFIWCLIGNIVGEHGLRINNEIKKGTKHFSSNTKVYCFPPLWGDGYENIKVIGRHRKSKRFVVMVIPSKYVTNWRLQKVYRPYILKVMHFQYGWTDSEKDKERILEMLSWLPKNSS